MTHTFNLCQKNRINSLLPHLWLLAVSLRSLALTLGAGPLQTLVWNLITVFLSITQDLEVLSQEIVRLSKDTCTSSGGDPTTTG